MNPPPVVPAPPPTGAGPAIHLHTTGPKTPAASGPARGRPPSLAARHPGPVAAAGVGVTGLAAACLAIPFGIAGAAGGVAGVALVTAGGVATHRRLQRDPSKPRPPRAARTGGLLRRRQRTDSARTVTSTTGRPALPRGGPAGGPGPAPQRRGLARLFPASRRGPSGGSGAGGGPGSGPAGGPRPGGASPGGGRRRGPFGLGRRPNPSGATPAARPAGSGPQGTPPTGPARSWRHPFRRTPPASPSGRQPGGQAPTGRRTAGTRPPAGGGPHSPATPTTRRRFGRRTPKPADTGGSNRRDTPGGTTAAPAPTSRRTPRPHLPKRRRGKPTTPDSNGRGKKGQPAPQAWDVRPARQRRASEDAAARADAEPAKPAKTAPAATRRPTARPARPAPEPGPAEPQPDPGIWASRTRQARDGVPPRPAAERMLRDRDRRPEPAPPAAAPRPTPPKPPGRSRRADLGDSQWPEAGRHRAPHTSRRTTMTSGEITNQGGALAAAMARMDEATEAHAQHMARIADEVGDGPNAQAVKDYAVERARQAAALQGAGAELLSLSRQADAASHQARADNTGRPNPQQWMDPD